MRKLTFVLSLLIALVGINANAAMYIVGNIPFGDWNPGGGVEMTNNGNGTYSYTATINGTVYFVFGDGLNSNWDIFNANHRYGPTNGNENVTVGDWKTTQKAGDHGSYSFTGSGDDYVFTFDETNHRFKVEGAVEPINPLTGELFVLGQVNGNNWDPSAGIAMATTDENIFTLTGAEITDSGDGFGFFSFTSKLGANNDDWSFAPYRRGAQTDGTLVEDGVPAVLADWGSTDAFKVLPGTYDIVVNLSGNSVTLTKQGGEEPPVVEITSYTVVGPEAVFGTDWDITDTNNDMVLDPETGLYTWTADSVELTGNFGFKIVGNHDYSVYENPMGYDNNWIVNIAEEGLYNLVITLNAETHEINCVPTKLGGEEPPVEMVYTVAGPQAIFGSDWDATDTNNDMILENGIYTWTKENVELAAGSFGFKVVGNHDWANEWPIGFDNNWIKYVDEAGIYTIEITYDPEAADSLKITCVITKTGEIEPQHYTGDVYILGDVNDNGGWFTNKGVKMTRDDENYLYTATITTTGEAYVDPETNIGYSYFTFTKQLVDSAADWEGIAPYRFGAVSDGDFWVTDETLGIDIALVNNGATFKIPAGEWNLTLSVDNMTLQIEKAESDFIRGDVDKDGFVKISDVTALINYLLSGNAEGIDLRAADCDQDTFIRINDVTTLINYLLSGKWE